jgi:hypothetical protein
MIRDTEILKKKIGTDFKSFIKNSSNDYMKKLLEVVQNGFIDYYDELNKRVIDELNSQETQQKNLHEKIEKYEKSIESIGKNYKIRIETKKKIIQNFSDLKRKAFLFKVFKTFHNYTQNYKIKKHFVEKIFQERMKRKGLNLIKKFTILEKTNLFENKLKERTAKEFCDLEENLKMEKEKILILIQKAEEKLKHENRKKVQTKLQLDQIVLRGVTALNMKALTLSQNSLNGNKKYLNVIIRCSKN